MKGFFLLIGVKFLWLILLNISFLRNPYSNYYWTKKQFFRWRAIANLLWVSFAIAIACIILFSSEKFSYQTNVLISVLTFAECTIIAIWTMILEIIAKIQTMKLLRKNIQETIQKNAHITDQKTLLHICQIEYRSSFFTKDIIKIFYAVQKNQSEEALPIRLRKYKLKECAFSHSCKLTHSKNSVSTWDGVFIFSAL